MTNYNDNFIMLSSSCKVTMGKHRSVIIDFDRGVLYYIKNEFAELLQKFEGYPINHILSLLDDEESKNNFYLFLDFLTQNELIFLTYFPESFPRRTSEFKRTPTILDNLIIDLDESKCDSEYINQLVNNIRDCKIPDVQIRLITKPSEEFLIDFLYNVENSGVKYVELFCTAEQIPLIFAKKLIIEVALLSKVVIFESVTNMHTQVTNELSDDALLTFGDIYESEQKYNPIEMCGIINKHTMDFSGIDAYNMHHYYNGCLYKKASISSTGDIKNCPSFEEVFGNIKVDNLCCIVQSDTFQKVWKIKKDKISICRECELRYCCSDCRAHRLDKSDLYSCPAKCSYDIVTGKWIE